jgi:hypothetical protein
VRTLPSILSVILVASAFSLAACHQVSGQRPPSPIVGTWLVKIPEAPFPMHMIAFHADGTAQQSNPDAGDPNTSDSNAMGAWAADSAGFKGRLVEITADRTTHLYTSRGEISFKVTVNGNSMTGKAVAIFYDDKGKRLREPVQATLEGQRILP